MATNIETGPIIAVDMDDVLCSTVGALTECELSKLLSLIKTSKPDCFLSRAQHCVWDVSDYE